MKFLTLAAICVAFCTSASARGAQGYNNGKNANAINRQSYNLKPGKYRFVNVKTHQGLSYVHANQQLYAAHGKGDFMTVSRHEKHVIISPSASNNKCMSAQWNYAIGADGAAALYACRVKRDEMVEGDEILAPEDTSLLEFAPVDDVEERLVKKSLEKRVALREAKQYFYVHPGCKKNAVHIVAFDHLTDMKTRVVGASSSLAPYNHHSRLANIVTLNQKDMSQCWYVYNAKGQLVHF